MKILEVEIRVLAAWNNHGVSGAKQLTSAVNKIKLHVSKKTEAQMHT